MILKDFIEQVKHYPEDTIILAYDPEDEAVIPVTGLLFTPDDKASTLEICTDDNS